MSTFIQVDEENPTQLRRSKRLSGSGLGQNSEQNSRPPAERKALVDISNQPTQTSNNTGLQKLHGVSKVNSSTHSASQTTSTTASASRDASEPTNMLTDDENEAKTQPKAVVEQKEPEDVEMEPSKAPAAPGLASLDDETEEDALEAANSLHSELYTVRPMFGAHKQSITPDMEYDDDIYRHLLRNEIRFVANPNYMLEIQRDIQHSMRSILIDWLVEVCSEYQLSRQTLYLTVNYIDRLLSKISVDRSKLQLVGITAMFIASKYEQLSPPRVDDFVYISDNTYTREEVLQLESVFLHYLGFNLTAPTPYEFFRRYTSVVSMTTQGKHLTHFLMERLLQEANYTRHRPSVVTASAMFLALYALKQQPWSREFEVCSGYKFDDIRLCVKEMHTTWLKAISPTETLQAVVKKYASSRFLGASKVPPPVVLQ